MCAIRRIIIRITLVFVIYEKRRLKGHKARDYSYNVMATRMHLPIPACDGTALCKKRSEHDLNFCSIYIAYGNNFLAYSTVSNAVNAVLFYERYNINAVTVRNIDNFIPGTGSPHM